jgi:hypothetical protein
VKRPAHRLIRAILRPIDIEKRANLINGVRIALKRTSR